MMQGGTSQGGCLLCGATGPHACTGARSPVMPIIPPARAPVLCPVCKGVTTMPTSFYDRLNATVNGREKCRSCNGRGIV